MRRPLTLLLVAVMLLTLFSACSGGNTPATNPASPGEPAGSGKLFDEPVHISMMLRSHPSYPADMNWVVFQAIQDATNVIIDADLLQNDAFYDKIDLVEVTQDFPDIMTGLWRSYTTDNGALGCFVEVMSIIDQLPNLSAMMNDPDWTEYFQQAIGTEGEMYGFPSTNYKGTNRRIYYYREDLFDQYNLTVPTTFDELYEVCKQYKELVPDSYPFNPHQMANISGTAFGNLAYQWGLTNHLYTYNYDTKRFSNPLDEPALKDMIIWLNKMYTEGLMPPDIGTIAQDQTRSMALTGQSIITLMINNEFSAVNQAFEAEGSAARVSYMPPPSGGTNGKRLMWQASWDDEWWCVSTKSKVQDEACKFIDWFYSPEVEPLCSWGVEGESYEVTDGTKSYIIPDDAEDKRPTALYGVGYRGTFRRFDPVAKLMTNGVDPVMLAMHAEAAKWEAPFIPDLAMTVEESEAWSQNQGNVAEVIVGGLSKMVIGERSIDTWDALKEEANRAGYQDMLKIKNATVERVYP